MSMLLGFFSDLILFTAGIGVVIFWLILMAVVGETIIEIFNEVTKREGKSTTLDEEEY